MSPLMVGVVSVLYGITALDQALKGDWAWTMVWLCYGLANIGLFFLIINK